jgi:DNA-binding GntR family transcriptional regulator
VVRELSADEAGDVYGIRAVLEVHATRLFVKNASDAQIAQLDNALQDIEKSYKNGHIDEILIFKNKFYHVLYEGAASETLGQMLASLHARVWRWRALGLSHPKRSKRRSKESVGNLKSILAAIKERDADHAERITREEAHKAAEEVMRLLAS